MRGLPVVYAAIVILNAGPWLISAGAQAPAGSSAPVVHPWSALPGCGVQQGEGVLKVLPALPGDSSPAGDYPYVLLVPELMADEDPGNPRFETVAYVNSGTPANADSSPQAGFIAFSRAQGPIAWRAEETDFVQLPDGTRKQMKMTMEGRFPPTVLRVGILVFVGSTTWPVKTADERVVLTNSVFETRRQRLYAHELTTIDASSGFSVCGVSMRGRISVSSEGLRVE
jgi:hypothetical protein